jgi:hypothetical protein
LAIQLSDPLAANFDGRELLAHLCAKRRKRVRLDPMLSGKSADRKPRLNKPAGRDRKRVGRRPEGSGPRLRLLRSPPDRATPEPPEHRMICGASLDLPSGLA